MLKQAAHVEHSASNKQTCCCLQDYLNGLILTATLMLSLHDFVSGLLGSNMLRLLSVLFIRGPSWLSLLVLREEGLWLPAAGGHAPVFILGELVNDISKKLVQFCSILTAAAMGALNVHPALRSPAS